MRIKWLIIVVLVTLIGASAIGYFIFTDKKPTPKNVLESGQLKDDLAQGKCSENTIADLEIVASQNSTQKAKLYEDLGACYVYAQNYQKALEAYKSARQAYIDAGLNDSAMMLDGAISGVESAIVPESEPGPEEFIDPGGGM